jgi:organic hydroperoxide reductase OsmC/OhrA
MDHAAHRAGLDVTGAGTAHGTVTKRPDDGLYAFVAIETQLAVELAPRPGPAAVQELLERAERGCFVSNSLKARPRHRWIVNGQEVDS